MTRRRGQFRSRESIPSNPRVQILWRTQLREFFSHHNEPNDSTLLTKLRGFVNENRTNDKLISQIKELAHYLNGLKTIQLDDTPVLRALASLLPRSIFLPLDRGIRSPLICLHSALLNLRNISNNDTSTSPDFGLSLHWNEALLDVMKDVEIADDDTLGIALSLAFRALEASVEFHPNKEELSRKMLDWLRYLIPAFQRAVKLCSISITRATSLTSSICDGFGAITSLSKLALVWQSTLRTEEGLQIVHQILECIVTALASQSIRDNGQFVATTALAMYMGSFIETSIWMPAFALEKSDDVDVVQPWLKGIKLRKEVWNLHGQISLYQALVSTLKDRTLESRVTTQCAVTLYEALFHQIYQLCDTTTSVTIRTYALFALGVWMQTSKRSLSLANDLSKCLKPPIFQRMFDWVVTLWDASSDAVVPKLVDVLEGFVDIALSESSSIPQQQNVSASLADQVILDVMKMDWTVKAKYEIMMILVDKIGIRPILRVEPLTLTLCFDNFKVTKVATNIRAFVVRCIRKYLNSLEASERIHSNNEFWIRPLTKALVADEHNVRKVLSEAVVTDIIRDFPQVSEWLLTEIECLSSPLKVSAHFAIHKSLRLLGLTSLVRPSLLHSAMVHVDMNTRIDALAYVCEGHKGSEEVEEMDLNAVKLFLAANVAVQSSEFRQRFASYFKKLLFRLRRTIYANWRDYVNRQALVIKAGVEADGTSGELKEKLDYKRDFLEWILSFAIYSTYPGAPFQRKESALALLSHFLESEKGGKNSFLFEGRVKTSPFEVSMNRRHVIEALITTLVHDKYTSTRMAAFELLRGVNGELSGYDLKELIALANSLMGSRKYNQAESGALVTHLLAVKYARELSRQVEFTSDSHDGCGLAPYERLIIQLLDMLHAQIEAAKTSWAVSFGVLMALRNLLGSVDYTKLTARQSQSLYSRCISSRVVELVRRACHIALPAIMEVSADHDADDEEFDQEDTDNLEMAYAFRVVKEAAQVLGALLLSVPFPDSEGASFMQVADIELSCTFLRQLAVTARHRGAFTAVITAFGDLCQRLFNTTNSKLALLPKRCLDEVLATTNSSDVGITRRSAGVPSTTVSILRHESDTSRKPLLQYTYTRVLEMIRQLVAGRVAGVDDEKAAIYMSQIHGFNILRVLVDDSILGPRLVDNMGELFATCIYGFHSSNFSVRNCAGMMFSTLLNKTLGLKSVREDTDAVNFITAHEFFDRFPSLKHLFVNELKIALEVLEQSGEVVPTLYPILTVLTKLKPVPSKESEDEGRIFRELIHRFAFSEKYHIREMAAKCLPALVQPSSVMETVDSILGCATPINQDKTHGCLLQVKVLLKSLNVVYLSHAQDEEYLDQLAATLTKSSWLYKTNTCLLLQAEYLNIVFEYLLSNASCNPIALSLKLDVWTHCGGYIKQSTDNHASRNRRIGEKSLLAVSTKILLFGIVNGFGEGTYDHMARALVDSFPRIVRDTAMSSLLCFAGNVDGILDLIVKQVLDPNIHPHSLIRALELLQQATFDVLKDGNMLEELASMLSRIKVCDAIPYSVKLLGILSFEFIKVKSGQAHTVLAAFVYSAMIRSQPTQPVPSRRAVALAIQPVLCILTPPSAQWEIGYIQLLFVLDSLLEDDDGEVRHLACRVLGEIVEQLPTVPSVGRELMTQILAAGPWSDEGWKMIKLYFEDLALGLGNARAVLETEIANERIVFVRESDNLHREALRDAQLGCSALALLLSHRNDTSDVLINRIESNVTSMLELSPKLGVTTLPRRPEVFILIVRHLLVLLVLVQHVKYDCSGKERVLHVYNTFKTCLGDFFIFDDVCKLIDAKSEGKDITHTDVESMYRSSLYKPEP
ncbi:hypothetical protein SeLEV6574_g00120 [Synchytrium endobioticum]|uniref:Uncharacterized protein n=1 Tax=Synchytrium endobioticum TaxID=286115 RepID=A0A507DLH4_9FUNG|nr:hypothetical protein SeLEV6574_g00120 [Synchytrium endobioticum]